MIRNIDNLGRLVIPSEYRKELGIENGSSLNMELEKDKIVITNPDRVDYKARVEKAIKYMDNTFNISSVKEMFDIMNKIENILNGEEE